MVNPATDPVVVNDTTKLIKDISALYLSEKFSDITLTVGSEKIFAHKVIKILKHFCYDCVNDVNFF